MRAVNDLAKPLHLRQDKLPICLTLVYPGNGDGAIVACCTPQSGER